jgi:hypothetical protein
MPARLREKSTSKVFKDFMIDLPNARQPAGSSQLPQEPAASRGRLKRKIFSRGIEPFRQVGELTMIFQADDRC